MHTHTLTRIQYTPPTQPPICVYMHVCNVYVFTYIYIYIYIYIYLCVCVCVCVRVCEYSDSYIFKCKHIFLSKYVHVHMYVNFPLPLTLSLCICIIQTIQIKEKSLRYRFNIQHCFGKWHRASYDISCNRVDIFQAALSVFPGEPSQSDIIESSGMNNWVSSTSPIGTFEASKNIALTSLDLTHVDYHCNPQ